MTSSPQTDANEVFTDPGQTLREARESRSLELADIARQLNLPNRTLVLLEAGEYAHLPGHTFIRGYIRSYAKLLGLDPERLVLEFDRCSGTDASGSRVRNLEGIAEPVRHSPLGLRLLSFAVLLLLAGGAFYLWQGGSSVQQLLPEGGALRHIEVEGADGRVQIHPLDEPAAGAEQPLPMTAAPSPSEAVEAASPAEGDVAPVQEGEAAAAPQDPLTQSQAAAQAEPAAPATVTDARGNSVELRYTAACWTKVTDAGGKVLLNALVPAGVTHVLKGHPPFEVVLGFSPGVEVFYKGAVVSLVAYRSGDTAHLTLGR